MKTRLLLAAAVLALTAPALTAQTASWTVKPEWVRAHEEFLASDVLQGRGSATHDELVTATYVASEFEGYGLQHAPGMDSYIQRAELRTIELDGHASLAAGAAQLQQGSGFALLVSGGETMSGPLRRIAFKDAASARVNAGDAVLITGVPSADAASPVLRKLRAAHPSLVILSGDASLQKLIGMYGSRTRTPISLMGDKPRAGSSMVLLNTGETFAAAKDGDTVTLTVKQIPTEPRYTYNAIGYLPGTDATAGTLLLTAHLDHLGIGTPVNGDAIYNGANDDAAGTTAVLELAHALAAGQKLRRSILFVCYGSEELGGFGSTFFGEHPPVPLKDIAANVEFEMIGSQDPKMPKGTLLLTGWDRSNLGPELKKHGALLGPDPYPEQHFFERSDNYSLALMGVVAHTAAGWGTPPTYHQPNDDLAHLDIPFMTTAIQSLVEPVRWLANSDFTPKWNAGGQPKP